MKLTVGEPVNPVGTTRQLHPTVSGAESVGLQALPIGSKYGLGEFAIEVAGETYCTCKFALLVTSVVVIPNAAKPVAACTGPQVVLVELP